jgi:TRAP transporter TAXI family solute receptor
MLSLLGIAAARLPAQAQEPTSFSIGTAGRLGTYYPVGDIIARAISRPPGAQACADGGPCGVPGVVATAVLTEGSVANVADIVSGALNSGFMQSDVAYWAATGSGLYDGKPRVEVLRAIANLYQEAIHLVVRRGSGIASIADLKGKRVSLDEDGSGTMVDALLILRAYGLDAKDIVVEKLKPQHAGDQLRAGSLDAFFSIAGWRQPALVKLAEESDIELLPIEGPQVERLISTYSYFSRDRIPENAYRNVGGVNTLAINAIWATSSKAPEKLIYDITAALWNANTRRLLDQAPSAAKGIRLETAVQGLGILLHPGAEKYYLEKGVRK